MLAKFSAPLTGTKKYESTKTKAEVSKELKQNDSDKNTPNNSTKAGNLGPNGEATYRENWKARSKAEQQKPENTMVFNFVNSKRDVTHIENDGLDLSKRSINSKKKTQIQLSKVRSHTFIYNIILIEIDLVSKQITSIYDSI